MSQEPREPREFWIYKQGEGTANPDYQAIEPKEGVEDFYHVIEKSYADQLKSELAQCREREKFLEAAVDAANGNCERYQTVIKAIEAELAAAREANKVGGEYLAIVEKERDAWRDQCEKLAGALENIAMTETVMPNFNWSLYAREALAQHAAWKKEMGK